MRILLADDDPHVRSAVRLLLENEPGISVVAECATTDCLLDRIAWSRPDVVLLDWDLPGLRTSSVLRSLRNATTLRVVALSGRPEQRFDALRQGAVSFVSKVDAPESLLTVLRGLRA